MKKNIVLFIMFLFATGEVYAQSIPSTPPSSASASALMSLLPTPRGSVSIPLATPSSALNVSPIPLQTPAASASASPVISMTPQPSPSPLSVSSTPAGTPAALGVETRSTPTPAPTGTPRASATPIPVMAQTRRMADTTYRNILAPALSFVTQTDVNEFYKDTSLPSHTAFILLFTSLFFVLSGLYLIKGEYFIKLCRRVWEAKNVSLAKRL